MRGVGDHVLRRRRLVVGEVVDRPGAAPLRPGNDRRSEVFDVDAVEQLPRLDDAARGAGAHIVDGAAPRTVDAGEPEDLDAPSGCAQTRPRPPPPRAAAGSGRRSAAAPPSRRPRPPGGRRRRRSWRDTRPRPVQPPPGDRARGGAAGDRPRRRAAPRRARGLRAQAPPRAHRLAACRRTRAPRSRARRCGPPPPCATSRRCPHPSRASAPAIARAL